MGSRFSFGRAEDTPATGTSRPSVAIGAVR
jgi:hypothetical protein